MFRTAHLLRAAWCAVALGLAACGGDIATTGASAPSASAPSASASTNLDASSSTSSSSGAASSSSSSSSGAASSSSASSSSAGASGAGSGPAARLAVKLGKPSRLLVGLGGQGLVDVVSAVQSQALKPDIYERYLGLA